MADNDGKIDEQVHEDSRFSLLTDALDQATQKVISKILRYESLTKLKMVTILMTLPSSVTQPKIFFRLPSIFEKKNGNSCPITYNICPKSTVSLEAGV